MRHRNLSKTDREAIVKALRAVVKWDQHTISVWVKQPRTEEAIAAIQAAKGRAAEHGRLASMLEKAEQVDLWYDG